MPTCVGVWAEVIAAAAGTEKALEKDGNGVFTRALLQVLKEQRQHGALSVGDLRGRVAKIVKQAMEGSQTPVMRAESLEFDFPLLLAR